VTDLTELVQQQQQRLAAAEVMHPAPRMAPTAAAAADMERRRWAGTSSVWQTWRIPFPACSASCEARRPRWRHCRRHAARQRWVVSPG
jgi:hypothetical protein